jgi:3-hydroxyacyl-CoA dehydrogenase/enoyl-CoA hydratase/3-hydroxybutyryl-CoA epimerase
VADKAIADDAVKGVVVASAKKDFIAGGDLESLLAVDDVIDVMDRGYIVNGGMRRIEKGGKPFVAAINGVALGGGLEICLGLHNRIASDKKTIRVGLPEATLGLLPGAGGTQRLPRLVGIKAATPLILEGTALTADDALGLGILDAIVPEADLIDAAKAMIHEGRARAVQPWDERGFKFPGGPSDVKMDTTFFAPQIAALHGRTLDNQPGLRNILSCIFHGSKVDIDTALLIERRYFASTIVTPEAKNTIRTGFFSMQNARKLGMRPEGFETKTFTKVGVLGAGMMGAGIAYSTAAAGIDVVLLDRDQSAADKGKAYSAKVMDGQIKRGRKTEQQKDALLSRITATTEYDALAGCDLVIEAVFEDRGLKADVTKKAEAVLAEGAIMSSNTSTLPITGLAEASRDATKFIGLHFFSPVDRMQLVEVIVGEDTSPETLAHSLDYVAAIRKVPVVVNDSRGFYATRGFRSFVAEGLAMVSEGINPALVENAAKQVGMPVGPLTVQDEVSLELGYKVRSQAMADLGNAYEPDPGHDVVFMMVEKAKRLGRKSGGGFYTYAEDGTKSLWAGIEDYYPRAEVQPTLEECVKRIAYIQSLEAVHCMEEGVLTDPRDADLGSILGWGFPMHRGGAISQIHSIGLTKFIADCEELAAKYGPRFNPPAMLREMAEKGEQFYAA